MEEVHIGDNITNTERGKFTGQRERPLVAFSYLKGLSGAQVPLLI